MSALAARQPACVGGLVDCPAAAEAPKVFA